MKVLINANTQGEDIMENEPRTQPIRQTDRWFERPSNKKGYQSCIWASYLLGVKNRRERRKNSDTPFNGVRANFTCEGGGSGRIPRKGVHWLRVALPVLVRETGLNARWRSGGPKKEWAERWREGGSSIPLLKVLKRIDRRECSVPRKGKKTEGRGTKATRRE